MDEERQRVRSDAAAHHVDTSPPADAAALQGVFRDHPHDRLIVITDEQTADRVSDPVSRKSYMVNVAGYKNGIGYGPWAHIDGFSEAIVSYLLRYES